MLTAAAHFAGRGKCRGNPRYELYRGTRLFSTRLERQNEELEVIRIDEPAAIRILGPVSNRPRAIYASGD